MPDAPWHVIQAIPNGDAEIERQLIREAAGVWVARQRVRQVNRQWTQTLLFPGYVFGQFTGQRATLGATIQRPGRRLGHFLCDPGGNPMVVPLGVLQTLWVQCSADGAITPPEPRQVRRGDTVRVVDGPFASFHGIVTLTTRERLIVLMSIFGRTSPAEFKRDAVELVA